MTLTEDYFAFLRAKSQANAGAGFKPIWLPDWLFDFQATLVEWALWTGRAAIFADCGLGKGPMELVWSGLSGPGKQCSRGCRGFQCHHRDEGVRAASRAEQPRRPSADPATRCPWDQWRPARDIA